jgi:hypothetical protein
MSNIFSPIQTRILKVLGNKTMKLSVLAEKVYQESETKPMSPRTAVRSAIQFINWKCEMQGLDWRIETDGAMGRNGCTVRKTQWL